LVQEVRAVPHVVIVAHSSTSVQVPPVIGPV
jgi:hypothetical protein